MNPWFRFYHEVLDDPKVQKLSPKLFKFWINMLCLACRTGGVLSLESIAFGLRLTRSKTETLIKIFRERGLLDHLESGLIPHGWDNRQFKSDSSTERVQRFREKKGNVSETLHETDQIQNRTDTEQKQSKKGNGIPAEKRAGTPDVAAELFAESYHRYMKNPYGWKRGDFAQLAALRKRLRIGTKDTPEDWDCALVNYFATPLGKPSLAHFATDFDIFISSPLDRYGKPINHQNAGGNGNGRSKHENNLAAAEELLAELSTEARRGS